MDAAARLAASVANALAIPRVALGAGIALAAAAAVAAPSNDLLPGPRGALPTLLAVVVLAAAFAAGYVRPLYALFGLVVLAVLEGAIRKWLVNDVTVFLTKDFLALGIYAAVLPHIRREDWRRPWWLVAPLCALTALAVLSAPLSNSVSQAVIGLRAYVIYVPLLWAAPALVSNRKQVTRLCALVLGLAAANGVLAVAQALSGSSVLNRLVSGALSGLITLQGVSYIRPSGTFMQVGVVAAFLFFGTLVAFALLVDERRKRWLALILAAFGLIVWGVVYSSARSLFGSLILAYLVLAAALLYYKRYIVIFALPLTFAASVFCLFTVVPWTQTRVSHAVEWIQRYDYVTVHVRVPGAKEPVTLRVPPDIAKGIDARLRSKTRAYEFHAIDEHDNDVLFTYSPKSGVGIQQQTQTVLGVDASGKIVHVAVGSGTGGSNVGGFLGRAADFNKAGGQEGLWGSRIAPLFKSIVRPHLLGHGTGTMTLGSGYAAGGATTFLGESSYKKAWWELGTPGLVLFVWLVAALAVAAVLGFIRSSATNRSAALIGAAAALILPVWYLFTFALDFPVVSILLWTFVGLATSAEAVSSRDAAQGASATGAQESRTAEAVA